MVDHQSLMPKIDKIEAKELAQPTASVPQTATIKKIPQKKEAIKLPKIMYQLVSVSVSENISLKNVFIELARQAGIDLQLDHTIDAKIIFTAQKRPFIDVIKSMCEMANLRYDVIDNAIRIERDTPYS
jgi:general secretion pathway protein D